MNNKITVVIPTFNESKTIESLLNSLFNQSLLPDEIIISDGGSTDNTLDKIKLLKNNKINIKVIGRKNKCRGSGRNAAIEESNNDLIALIDSGIIAEKNWLSNLYQKVMEDNTLDVIYGMVKPIHLISDQYAIFSKLNYNSFRIFN